MEKENKDSFRALFEMEAFGFERNDVTGLPLYSPKTKKTSKSLTKSEWEERVFIISNWDTGTKELPKKKFHQTYGPKYKNWKGKYFVTKTPQGNYLLWHRDEKGKHTQDRWVVHIEQVFDIIFDYHHQGGHKKADLIMSMIKPVYFNVSKPLVQLFCAKCPICAAEIPKVKAHKGAVKPIVSHAFRDRFQVRDSLPSSHTIS